MLHVHHIWTEFERNILLDPSIKRMKVVLIFQMNPISWWSFLINLPPNFHQLWAETFCRVHGFETEGIRIRTIFQLFL